MRATPTASVVAAPTHSTSCLHSGCRWLRFALRLVEPLVTRSGLVVWPVCGPVLSQPWLRLGGRQWAAKEDLPRPFSRVLHESPALRRPASRIGHWGQQPQATRGHVD
jgi:hypothetical protein